MHVGWSCRYTFVNNAWWVHIYKHIISYFEYMPVNLHIKLNEKLKFDVDGWIEQIQNVQSQIKVGPQISYGD